MNEYLKELIEEALNLKRQIKEIEDSQLSPLSEQLKMLGVQITSEMVKDNIDNAECDFGSVTMVTKKGTVKLDKDAITKDLGLPDLSKYETVGDPIQYPLYNLKKE